MESGLWDIGGSTRLDRRQNLLLAAVLFAAVFAAYFPARAGGRLLDDDLHITRPEMQSWGGLGRIWFDVGATQQYYPVVHTAFWLEHRLWGDAMAGYHLGNVLLHGVAAVLTGVLMRRLGLRGAWLAAFLFALHPVCVESVAWIAEQKNTLSTVFALGASIAYLRFDQTRGRSHYGLALVLFALALLSKTAVVTVPAVLLVVVWWRRSRLAWRRDVGPLLPWFACGGAASVATLSLERRLMAEVGANFQMSLGGRFLLAGRAFWFYLGKVLWPAGLTFVYPRWSVNALEGWQYGYPLGMAGLGAGLWFLARRTRGPLAAFLCYAGLLAPALGFLNMEWFVFSYVADHLQYLACLSVIVPLAALAANGAARLPAPARRLFPAVAVGLAGSLGVLTWRQCRRYADPVMFYRTAAALNPAAAAAYDNLGRVLATMPGHRLEAIAQFETALRITPNVAQGHEDLGDVLLQDSARRAEAAAQFEIALRLQPDRKSARDKLALAWSGLPGRLPDAIAEYRASLRSDPSNPRAHDSLGVALSKMPGRMDEAIAQYHEALRLKPDFAEAHNDLGLALAQSGHLSEAIVQFEEALRLKPDFAGPHNNLGLAWTLLPGRTKDAVAEFKEAVRLDPEFAPAWHSLGQAWYRLGNLRASADAFREELRLSPDNLAARQALAAVTQASQPR